MAVPSELPLAMFSKLTRFLPVEGLLDLGCTGKSLYCVATDDAARRAANLEDEEAFLAWYNSPYSLGLGGRKMPLGCMTYSILVPKKTIDVLGLRALGRLLRVRTAVLRWAKERRMGDVRDLVGTRAWLICSSQEMQEGYVRKDARGRLALHEKCGYSLEITVYRCGRSFQSEGEMRACGEPCLAFPPASDAACRKCESRPDSYSCPFIEIATPNGPAFECCSCCPKTNCPCCFKVLTRTEGLKCETCGDTYCPGDIKNFSDVGVTCMFCLEEIERHLMFDA